MKTEKELGKLHLKLTNLTIDKFKGHSDEYIQGYMDCKNWIKSEIRKILGEK